MSFDQEAIDNEIAKYNRRGLSSAEIARKVDMSIEYVNKELYGHAHQDKQRRAVRLLKKGYTRKEIANKLDLNYTMVCDLLSQAGFSAKDTGEIISDADKEELFRAYLNGATGAELAKKYGRSRSSIYNLLSDNGIHKNKVDDWEKEALARRYLAQKKSLSKSIRGISMSKATAYWHRFVDPIQNPEFYQKYEIGYDDIKLRYRFSCKNFPISKYWMIYSEYHEEGKSMSALSETHSISKYHIRKIVNLGSSSAFVAVWELARKLDKLP